jgi:hypothetical protein
MNARNLLQIADRGKGRVQVSWRQGNDVPRVYPDDLPFSDPLTEADHAELRWYLEDFLQFPYGAERDRALALEKRMAGWGEALFEQVFPKAAGDPDPRGFYQEAVREGLRSCELCISSDNEEFLNIPWELIRDPTKGRGYLAPMMAGLYRQRVTQKIESRPDATADGAFRILLVVARPYGERDVPLGAAGAGGAKAAEAADRIGIAAPAQLRRAIAAPERKAWPLQPSPLRRARSLCRRRRIRKVRPLA